MANFSALDTMTRELARRNLIKSNACATSPKQNADQRHCNSESIRNQPCNNRKGDGGDNSVESTVDGNCSATFKGIAVGEDTDK